jgi:hypothetical protein
MWLVHSSQNTNMEELGIKPRTSGIRSHVIWGILVYTYTGFQNRTRIVSNYLIKYIAISQYLSTWELKHFYFCTHVCKYLNFSTIVNPLIPEILNTTTSQVELCFTTEWRSFAEKQCSFRDPSLNWSSVSVFHLLSTCLPATSWYTVSCSLKAECSLKTGFPLTYNYELSVGLFVSSSGMKHVCRK